MGNAAVRPSQRVANLLRDRRQELKLTLREVSERIGDVGERLPISTLGRIEKGQLEPGVRRLQLLLRFYGISASVIDELTELDVAAQSVASNLAAQELFDAALRHWKSGAMELGLAHGFLAMEQAAREGDETLRQSSKLLAAGYSRSLGRLFLARHLLDSLLCEPPERALRWKVLMLASSVWQLQGSDDAALGLIREAKKHLPVGDDEAYANWFGQFAKILLCAGEIEQAVEASDHALRHHKNCENLNALIRVYILRIRVHEKTGDLPNAIVTARKVIAMSREHAYPILESSGHLELGRLMALAGDLDQSVVSLREGLAQAIRLGDEDSEFLAWFRLWKSYSRIPDAAEAAKAFAQAKALSSNLQRSSNEIEEVRATKAPSGPRDLAKQRKRLR